MPRALGITSLQILAAAGRQGSYGLDIVAQTGLPSGTVYPTLARLKDAGLLRAVWEDHRQAERSGRPRRRYYLLTASGGAALAEGAARLRTTATALGRLAEGRS